MKIVIKTKVGDRGFYDAGRVKDMTPKQLAKFKQSYDRYLNEYVKRANAGEMYQKMLTPNQYLNEYAARRSEYISKGVDPGKRHLPEQIARGQQFERAYRSDLHFYQELKQRGDIDQNFKEFRRTSVENFTKATKAGIDKILSDTNAYLKAQGWKSSDIADYIGRHYYDSE